MTELRRLQSKDWPEAKGMIATACERSSGRFTPDTIGDMLVNGKMQGWTITQDGHILAVLVTEVLTYATGLKTLSFVIVTGVSHETWLHHTEDFRALAKEANCDIMEAWARPGWAKVTGWRETHRLIETRV